MAYQNNPHKTKGNIRPLCQVNLTWAKAVLGSLADSDWEKFNDESINYNKAGIVLRQCHHITLKFTDRRSREHLITFGKLWQKWRSLIEPILLEVSQHYGYRCGHYPIIMLAKLPPKSMILPHVDGKMDRYAPHKIHIPLETNDEAYFFVNEKRWHLKSGTAYEVDNISKHSAINNGSSDRIHLIFEYMFGVESGLSPSELSQKPYEVGA